MLYCDRHKFVYLNPPKTGNRSMLAMLKLHTEAKGFSISKELKILRGGHILYTDISDEQRHKISEYNRVISVRNIYDRVYSAYGQFRRNICKSKPGYVWSDPVLCQQDLSFKQVIERYLLSKEFLTNKVFHNFLPCHLYGNGDPAFFDTIIYNETFEENVIQFFSQIGVSEITVLHKNRASNPITSDPFNMKWEDYRYLHNYDRTSVEIINHVYKEDFECFGYAMLDPNEFPKIS